MPGKNSVTILADEIDVLTSIQRYVTGAWWWRRLTWLLTDLMCWWYSAMMMMCIDIIRSGGRNDDRAWWWKKPRDDMTVHCMAASEGKMPVRMLLIMIGSRWLHSYWSWSRRLPFLFWWLKGGRYYSVMESGEFCDHSLSQYLLLKYYSIDDFW